ncbi:MxaL protein [Piscinibacter sp. XHJ-5]|uniref:MxaL protein n=1 Tax=Piscinibacter sp. XHJ-5 TaxID=3037797 RepID=UPI0024531C7A|nr:MxaL protein [Piscinibacter sp. XHJ-5]
MTLRADLAIAGALLLLAAAVWMPPVTLQRPVFSYMVTFDITQSMDVEDVEHAGAPVSRLALARLAMRDALRRLPCGSRIGWSIFADYRALPLMMPVEVCGHYEELLASLDAIDGRMRWANASNVGKGVTWTVRSAKLIGSGVSVVFITDGHESPPLRGDAAPPMAGITPGDVGGWLIGVGGALPAPIPKTDRDGNRAGFWQAGDVVQRDDMPSHEHLSELREAHLQSLARVMGLGYRRLVEADALAKALLDARLARSAPVQTDVSQVPALLALLLLAWRFRPGLSLTRSRRRDRESP